MDCINTNLVVEWSLFVQEKSEVLQIKKMRKESKFIKECSIQSSEEQYSICRIN